MRKHLSYANVAATMALVIAVAGGTTAIAAKVTAPKNSVTTKSIRTGNVTASDLSNVIRVSVTESIPPSSSRTATANCPEGMRALGGYGGVALGADLLATGFTANARGWQAVGTNVTGTPIQVSANVYCLNNKPGKPFATN